MTDSRPPSSAPGEPLTPPAPGEPLPPELRDPARLRRLIRQGRWDRPTAGLAPGFVQANLVILPAEFALDFLTFCVRNPKPCPVLEVTAPGSPHPRQLAADADLRTDVPRYRIYRHGTLEAEVTDIISLWREDLVAVLLGCSFTFERALLQAGIGLRHWELGRNVPMYVTDRQCCPSANFRGPLVVSMRPIPHALVPRAVAVTAQYPRVHGAPVHIGSPAALGIKDLERPDYGDPVPVQPGEIPVFWACGVTPQRAALESRIPFMITHAPGHMFVGDRRDEDFLG